MSIAIATCVAALGFADISLCVLAARWYITAGNSASGRPSTDSSFCTRWVNAQFCRSTVHPTGSSLVVCTSCETFAGFFTGGLSRGEARVRLIGHDSSISTGFGPDSISEKKLARPKIALRPSLSRGFPWAAAGIGGLLRMNTAGLIECRVGFPGLELGDRGRFGSKT